MITPKISINDIPTIEDINGADSPSLIGFYKCDEGGGTTIYDYSGNDYHLELEQGGISETGFQDLSESLTTFPGWFTSDINVDAFLNGVAGTLLDTQSKVVVVTAQMKNGERPIGVIDGDYGTANDAPITASYAGFMIGCSADAWWGRMAEVGTPINTYEGTHEAVTKGDDVSLAIGFIPTDRLYQSVNGLTSTSDLTALASVDVQKDRFGFGASDNGGWVLIKNYQLWVFDSEPANMDMTIDWMVTNPGKIPPWWIGR